MSRRWIYPQDFRDLRRLADLIRKQAADLLDVTGRTIQNWKTEGARIPWITLLGDLFYCFDLEFFRITLAVSNTSLVALILGWEVSTNSGGDSIQISAIQISTVSYIHLPKLHNLYRNLYSDIKLYCPY